MPVFGFKDLKTAYTGFGCLVSLWMLDSGFSGFFGSGWFFRMLIFLRILWMLDGFSGFGFGFFQDSGFSVFQGFWWFRFFRGSGFVCCALIEQIYTAICGK